MPAIDYAPEQFRKIIDVNITGSFLCAQAFAQQWFERYPTPGSGAKFGGREPWAGAEGASVVLTGSMSGSVANFGLECAAL